MSRIANMRGERGVHPLAENNKLKAPNTRRDRAPKRGLIKHTGSWSIVANGYNHHRNFV